MEEKKIKRGTRVRDIGPFKTEDISGDEDDTRLIIDENEAQAGCVEDLPRPLARPNFKPVCARVNREDNVLHVEKNKQTEHIFSCPRCTKTFKRKVNLLGHLRAHKSGEKFYCAQCGEGFQKKSLLNFHVYCHNNQSYECFECGKRFKYKKQLVHHQRDHERETSQMDSEKEVDPPTSFGVGADSGYWSLKCKKCGKESRNQHDYDKHIIKHLTDTPSPSSVCDKIPSDELDQHVATQSLETNLIGKKCDKKCKAEETPYEHPLLDDKSVSCEICDQIFSREELEVHMNIHDLSLHSCHTCKKSFMHEKSLKIHLLSHTENDETSDQFLDELVETTHKESSGEQSCSQQMTVAKSSSKKIKKKKSRPNEIFVCHKCGKIFSSKQILLNHMPIHFQCRKCKKIFKNQRALDIHLIFLGDKKIISCCICGNLLHGKRELERHLSNHITEEYQLSKNSSEWEVKTKKIQTIIGNLREEREELLSQVAVEENIKIHKVTHAGKNSLRCSNCRKIVRLHHNLKDHIQPSLETVESGEELVYISRLGSPRSGSRIMPELYCNCSTSAETILVKASESPQKSICLGKKDQQRLKSFSNVRPVFVSKCKNSNQSAVQNSCSVSDDTETTMPESMDEDGEYSARYDPNALIKIGREVGPHTIKSNMNLLSREDQTESNSKSLVTKTTVKKEFLPTEVFIKEEWDIDLFGS